VRRIGVLLGAANDSEGQARARNFQQGLDRLGWMIGRNLRIDYRWGARDNPQQARSYAAELIALAPNVVVTQGSQNSEALLKETRSIPIIFVEASDPMSSGLVSSMAHPGGNLTGFTNFEFSISTGNAAGAGAGVCDLLRRRAHKFDSLRGLVRPRVFFLLLSPLASKRSVQAPPRSCRVRA
jgi:hypothetical protein